MAITMNKRRVAGAAAVLLGLGVLGVSSQPAFAWQHLFHVWDQADMPVRYSIATTDQYGGQDMDYLVPMVQEGYDLWAQAAPCSDFRGELDEILPKEDNIGFKKDGINRVTWDDPEDDLLEPGILAAALTLTGVRNTILNGAEYRYATDGDIIYNDNAAFATDEEECGGRPSIVATTTHEIGHLIGLGHSCERNEPCTDRDLLDATMFWQASDCEAPSQYFPNVDDIASINALYGPFASFACSNELDPDDPNTLALGVVPFELKCSIVSNNPSEVTGVSWSWGDGETTTGLQGTHTYTEPGIYTMNVCFEGERDACGEWDSCIRRTQYVAACGVPEPVFTYEPIEALTVRLLNETDVDVYDCISDVQWDIFKGEGTGGEKVGTQRAWEPEFAFPEVGTYTVVLNMGGPAGTGASALTFDVRNAGRRGGCDQGSVGLVGGLALTGAAALLLRRRRSA